MGLLPHKLLTVLLFTVFLFLLFTQDPSTTHATENLLKNPSFESTSSGIPADWIPEHSTTLFQATTSATQEGTFSAILSKISSERWTYVYQDVAATPLISYRLSGWVWWDDEKISKTSLRIDWLDEAGKRIGSKAKEVVAKLKQSAFQLLTLDEIAPEETAVARVEFFVNLSATNPVSPALFDSLWFGEFVGGDTGTAAFTFTIPETVTAGEVFEVNVSLQSFDPQTEYRIKFLAAPAGGKFYDGRTLSADGSKYLAWNAAWNLLPQLATDTEGNAALNLQVIINDNAPAGEYETKIRIRNNETEKTTDSEVQNFKVEAADLSEADGDSDEVFDGTLAEIKNLEL
ncbi:hypothetical protein L6258_03260, partial [Candidatus Parcubacteria bacterium]|nr:hypothetical protein [Candidatus Parcubacteria bacterium]